MRNIDYQKQKARIAAYIRDYLRRSGKDRVVLGLSGGIDSAVIAALCAEAIDVRHVHATILPYRDSNPVNVEDAVKLAKKLHIRHRTIDITPYVDTYFSENSPEATILRKGNFMARIRMCILYDLSAFYNALVVGTGNRSELLTGYTTQYGDNACAFEPIGHLYKTEVRELAGLLHVGRGIIDKKPSADLWQGQTDEEEIGMSYRLLDEILYYLFDEKISIEAIVRLGYNQADIQRVVELHKNSAFKRRLPELIE